MNASATLSSPVGAADCRLADGMARGRPARPRHQLEPVLQAQGDARQRRYALAGDELEPPALREGREEEGPPEPGEAITDANPRSTSEREIGEAVSLRLARRLEAEGVEPQRVGPQLGVPVHDPLRHHR